MKHSIYASYENLKIRPLEQQDLENLRNWRNDEKNAVFLTKIPYITPQMQQNWYEKYLQDPDRIVFAIEETQHLKQMIGSVSVYNFRGTIAEYGSFMIGNPLAKGKGFGKLSLLLCLHAGFEKFSLEKYDACVHEDNISARKVDEQVGFIVTGSHPFVNGGQELEIQLDKQKFYHLYPFVKKISVFNKD